MTFDYEKHFEGAVAAVKAEGRYRVFNDIKRECGAFPKAQHFTTKDNRPVTVWCSNDYLGMGQNPAVLAAMHDAIDRWGAGAGGTRNISGTNHTHVMLERELADLQRQILISGQEPYIGAQSRHHSLFSYCFFQGAALASVSIMKGSLEHGII